jgi:enoyl-CoA hydratase/carnithine racemase
MVRLSLGSITLGVRVSSCSGSDIRSELIAELGALMTDLEADSSVKVVVFQSANPDFFIAHLDVAKAAERPEVLDLWRDFVLRLSSAPIVSIAKIRGRTRGIGNEFVLACDMRFASRQNALFGNPEVGVGLIPGGGALEWLPRLVGRSRALEIVLSADDFDADIAERYGWVNRALDDPRLICRYARPAPGLIRP